MRLVSISLAIFITQICPTATHVRIKKRNTFTTKWFLTKLLNHLNDQLGTIKFTHDSTSQLENVYTCYRETYLDFNWN